LIQPCWTSTTLGDKLPNIFTPPPWSLPTLLCTDLRWSGVYPHHNTTCYIKWSNTVHVPSSILCPYVFFVNKWGRMGILVTKIGSHKYVSSNILPKLHHYISLGFVMDSSQSLKSPPGNSSWINGQHDQISNLQDML
jgi:hypothetical protein